MVKSRKRLMRVFGIIISVVLCTSPAMAKMQSEKIVIESGESHEVCVKLSFGENMNYAFIGGRELNFNIHYHENEIENFIVEEKLIKEEEHFFTAMVPHDYCLSWTNPNALSATVNVIYDVR